MKTPDLLALLFRAAASRVGLYVESNDPAKLRAKLYAARQTMPELKSLQLRLDPNGKAVLIAHKMETPDASEIEEEID